MLSREAGPQFINSTGNPFLGQGGTGDVLAGYLGGLLAQPGLQGDPLKTIRYAIWQHGAAADYLSTRKRTWTVEDLIQNLGTVGVA
jgi:NAD(P)H-hydrate epimerase